jgi:hypothetical protein
MLIQLHLCSAEKAWNGIVTIKARKGLGMLVNFISFKIHGAQDLQRYSGTVIIK